MKQDFTKHRKKKYLRSRWMLAVTGHRDITDGESRCLLALAAFMDKDGHCWPLIETITAEVTLSRTTVNSAIKKAVQLGLLEVGKKRKTGTACEHGGARFRNTYTAIIPPELNDGAT